MSTVDPIAGALLGTAAGDVLGAGVEGADREAAAAAVTSGLLPESGAVYSDDTQQAVVLAYHLLDNGGVVSANLAAEFVRTSEVMRGTGPGFGAFVAAVRRGDPRPAQPTAGNGAAMRSAPLGIWSQSRPEDLIDQAIAAAAVTHADPRGVAAGVAVPAAVLCASTGVEGTDLVWDAADHVTEAEHRVFGDVGLGFSAGDSWHTLSLALREAAPLVGSHPAEIADSVGRHAAATSSAGSLSGTHPYAVASVVTAIVVAAGGGDDPATVRSAVSLGGDTDTVGAMVGAIVGARRGLEDWPWDVPNADLLIDLGRRLASGAGLDGLPDLLDAVAL